MKSKSLVIDPVENTASISYEPVNKNSENDLVKWSVSCVCASERRRFNLQKSHSDFNKFIAGHESVGRLDKDNKKDLFVLLPHSNCLTRDELLKCSSCLNGDYNLCKCMNHAGLCSSEPGGLSEMSSVPSSQLLKVENLPDELAVFTEPLSCVLRSWKKIKKCKKEKVAIVGLGPIGCLHYIYSSIIYPETQYFLYETNQQRIDMFKRAFKEINYTINEPRNDLDLAIMANSTSDGFEQAKSCVRKDGAILLFSGFNDISYKCNDFFPEFIHREEFSFFDDDIYFYGSSGYIKEDLIDSMKTLRENNIFRNMITGTVDGLDSNKINCHYTEDESFDEPVLVKDLKGELSHHIKIQYFVNNYIEQ
jgi:threonine dehydrogenase-like Zn-dependent dehydrogenase